MSPAARRLAFVVESGTDVRLVEGLAERFGLRVFARRIAGGAAVSREPRRASALTLGPAGRLAFAGAAARWLRALDPPPDLVLVQGYGLAARAANGAARRMRVRSVMLVCSPVETYYRCRKGRHYPGKPYHPPALWALSWLARRNAATGNDYVVLSDHLAGVVRGHGARGTVHVIPVYGVDTALFAPGEPSRAAVRERLGLPAAGGLLFFSSRIAPEKDAETLLLALRRLVDAGRDVRLLHRSGGYRTFLAAAERAGVHERVIATDARHPHDGLADDYRACDVCVQASRAEGLGFSPLEALACETPVVAAAVGGLLETIRPGVTGWTYTPGDAEGLARAVAEAIDQPEEARRLAARGRTMVRQRFERAAAFDRLVEVLG